MALDHLTHSSNAGCLKNVVVPSADWGHVVRNYWVGGDRRRRKSIRSSGVLVKRDVSAERADSREAGGNEVSAKITEVIADLIVCLLAHRDGAERG